MSITSQQTKAVHKWFCWSCETESQTNGEERLKECPDCGSPTVYTYIERPMTRDEIFSSEGHIACVVPVQLDDILDQDRHSFKKFLSLAITETTLLDDVEYRITGHKGDQTLLVLVSGNSWFCIADASGDDQ